MNCLAIREWCDAELGSEIERVVGFSPRAGQIQAIRKLVIDRKDLILGCTPRAGVRASSSRPHQLWLLGYAS